MNFEELLGEEFNGNARLREDFGLRCQGLITVSINKKVLPNYPLKYAYN